MTTIAYDGKHLAADLRQTIGDTPLRLDRRKIVPFTHNGRFFLVGGAGQYGHIGQRVLAHLEQPSYFGHTIVSSELDCTVLLVELLTDDGAWRHRALLLTRDGAVNDVTPRQWAIGSGCDYALGAMAAGAPARMAVTIAAEHDVFTGDGVQDELIANWLQRARSRDPAFQPLCDPRPGQYAPAPLPHRLEATA